MKGRALRHQGEAEPHGSGPGLRDENVVRSEEIRPARIERGCTDWILRAATNRTEGVWPDSFPIAFRQTACEDLKNIADLDAIVALVADLRAMMSDLDRLCRINTRREGAAVEVGHRGADFQHAV